MPLPPIPSSLLENEEPYWFLQWWRHQWRHSDVISGKIAPWACEHDNSTKSYPILMKLHRIVPWWVRKNPIDFCHYDVISDVISGTISPWACEHDNSTVFHPIFTKLGRVDVIWVETDSIEWRHSPPLSAKIVYFELVNALTQYVCIQCSPNLIWLIVN